MEKFREQFAIQQIRIWHCPDIVALPMADAPEIAILILRSRCHPPDVHSWMTPRQTQSAEI